VAGEAMSAGIKENPQSQAQIKKIKKATGTYCISLILQNSGTKARHWR
jgi:hypothetical protein